MEKGRLEAFSDGVIAIIITIMVLEMKVPHDPEFSSLMRMFPVFISYVLSFIFVGIYWNNHHHLLQAAEKTNGGILWANLHLLFWLSLIPFVTGWMGENSFAPAPVALYGVVLFMSSVAYYILARLLIVLHGRDSTIAVAIGTDRKGRVSMILYALGVLVSPLNSWLSLAFYVFVAIKWLVPDKRIEKEIS